MNSDKQQVHPAGTGIGGMRNDIPVLPSWFTYVRYAQIVLTFIVFITSCVSLAKLGGGWFGWGPPFAIFTCVYTFLFLAGVLLVPKFAVNFYYKWCIIVAEGFAVLWWLVAFAGLATFASAMSIFNNDYYDRSGFYSGWRTVYASTAAGAAFGAFAWVSFCVTLVFYVLAVLKGRKSQQAYAPGGEAQATSLGPIGGPPPQPQAYDQQYQQYPSAAPTPAPQGYQQH